MAQEPDLVYYLHWIFAVAALSISWLRARSIFHPHFMFTTMLVVLISDFLVRGYDDPNLLGIPRIAVNTYQLTILAALGLIVSLTAFVHNRRTEPLVQRVHLSEDISSKIWRLLLLVSISILGFEILKRLGSVNWSVGEVVEQSLGPRGRRAWDLAAYQGNFVFSLITILLPFATLCFAYLSACRVNLLTRLIVLALYIFCLALLLTNGSRTPVALCVFGFGIIWVGKFRSKVVKLSIAAALSLGAVTALSLMRIYRAAGFVTVHPGRYQQEFSLVYHQDDSYYRAIAAFFHADRTAERWDAWQYVQAIVLNPIPRAIWPDKPLLDQSFYGGFKLDYVTISFLGEMVAMAGVVWAVFFSLIFAFLLYVMFFISLQLLRFPFGATAYLIVALYIYMCIRSTLNLTHFMYLPLFAIGVVLALSKFGRYRPSIGNQSSHVSVRN